MRMITGIAMFGWGCAAVQAEPLVHEAVVDASVYEVWEAFTTKAGMESWMVPHAEIDLRVGGKMLTNYHADGEIGDPNTIENTILSFEPSRMLSIKATKPPADFPYKDAIKDMWSVMYFEEVGPKRTQVRTVGMGYGDDENSQKLRAFFEAGNAWTLQQLKKKFAADSDAGPAETGGAASRSPSRERDGEPVLRLVRRLIGGEWIHESEQADGGVFRVRNVLADGPDGRSVVGRSWLGNADGMFYHGHTQVWREPGGGAVRFQNINERGAVARGAIRLAGDDALRWDWNQIDPSGKETVYRVDMEFTGADAYRMRLHMRTGENEWRQMNEVDFRRVQEAPQRFKQLRPTG
jgi:uncharacterized protein YndB with AHSA1/START domain